MYTLQFCDYDEETQTKTKQKHTLAVFYRVLPSVRAPRVIRIELFSSLFVINGKRLIVHVKKCYEKNTKQFRSIILGQLS